MQAKRHRNRPLRPEKGCTESVGALFLRLLMSVLGQFRASALAVVPSRTDISFSMRLGAVDFRFWDLATRSHIN